MASPARPAAASVSGAFGLPPDARCSYDQPLPRRREGLQDGRLVRTFVAAYGQPPPPQQQQQQQDGFLYPKDAVVAAVEECTRKQADALLHSLGAIGGRLSQLELYCYKLERSIGELRSDVMDYHSDSNANFKCIDRNLRQIYILGCQVHKSLQLLQDRQDLAETAKELSKLQIAHEAPSQTKGEAAGFPMLAARENGHSTRAPKHEVALLPLHQVNGTMHSPAVPVQVQTSNGFVLQHLVPVALSTQQHEQQQLNQAPVFYVQSRDRAKCTEGKAALEPLVQVVQPLAHSPDAVVQVELPQKASQAAAAELYPQPQTQSHRLQTPTQQVDLHTWHPQQPMVQVQQQQYSIQQVSRHMVVAQQPSSSPQSQLSAPQATPLFPPFSSVKPSSCNTETITRRMAGQPPYSSSQQQYQQQQHEVAHSFYGQGNTVLLPVADHNAQHQQPQPVQLHSQGPSCPPQPGKPSHCSAAPYAVQGNGQTYSSAYKNPSNCPATAAVVALLPQPPAIACMAYHPLGPQVVHNHPFGNTMVETSRSSVVGYPRDQFEMLPAITAAQPVLPVDKLNAGSNVTSSPREWSA
ncbi:Putative DUF1421 domain family protein [Zea mays]|uniref:Putative DUF1421 domain family protein n=1 Tax=Zea mays TaxID=4577 RepID=K7VKF7_MAIZE|nr:Putative DUF1421 domain family protein [Zea mays]